MMRALYDWAIRMVESPYALPILIVVSFIESSFFPIPPDILLIPLVLIRRNEAFKIALYCTISSVLGGYFGYFIGDVLYDSVGLWVLNHYNAVAQFDKFTQSYHEYGAWIVFMAGLTPFPYKIITIASGVVHLDLMVFIIASLFARGIRFFFIAWLLWKYGAPMKTFIEKNLGWLSIVFFVLLIGCFYLIKFL